MHVQHSASTSNMPKHPRQQCRTELKPPLLVQMVGFTKLWANKISYLPPFLPQHKVLSIIICPTFSTSTQTSYSRNTSPFSNLPQNYLQEGLSSPNSSVKLSTVPVENLCETHRQAALTESQRSPAAVPAPRPYSLPSTGLWQLILSLSTGLC